MLRPYSDKEAPQDTAAFWASEPFFAVPRVISSNMNCFVSDKWGKSEDTRQEEGLRQGDPLSCFLLVILITVVMLNAREQYSSECRRRGMTKAQRETENIFGFDEVEYADDANFI